MSDKVIQRNDTAANWQRVNPILSQGEIGIVIDGAKGYKIGDGVTHWNDLPYPANPIMSGATRPTLADNRCFQYFDTTLNKPIWWTGTKWVDANGTEV